MLCGIIRGIGKQGYASIANLIAYYCFSIPCCYIFAFVMKMDLDGLWLGMPCGVILLNFIYLRILYTADWQKIANDSIEHLAEE